MEKLVRWGNGWSTTEIVGERKIGEQVFAVALPFPESTGTIAHKLGDSDDWETIGWDNSEKNWEKLESDPRALSHKKSAWGKLNG